MAEPCQNRGFSVCVVLPALIIIRTCRGSALTRCFHEGGGRQGGWRNLRLSVFFLLLLLRLLRLPQHTFFSCLSFCLCVCFFGELFLSSLPPTQINIVLCHATRYISLSCSVGSALRKSRSFRVYLPFPFFKIKNGDLRDFLFNPSRSLEVVSRRFALRRFTSVFMLR